MADNTQDKAQIIQMATVTNSTPVTGQIWWDGTALKINLGGTTYNLSHPTPASSWTVTGATPNHTFNVASASTSTNAQAIATLILDLQNIGVIT